jgi:hypothetical protein
MTNGDYTIIERMVSLPGITAPQEKTSSKGPRELQSMSIYSTILETIIPKKNSEYRKVDVAATSMESHLIILTKNH